MKSGLSLVCIIISLCLYYYAPAYHDGFFNVICFFVFAFQSFFVLREDIRNEGVLNVNVLFLFSFFLVSYAFPILILGTPHDVRDGIEAFIDFNVSCRCSALCTLAISCYFYAYAKSFNRLIDFSSIEKASSSRAVLLFYYFIFFALLYRTLVFLRSVGDISVDAGVWTALYLACLPLALIYNCKQKQVRSIGQFIIGNLGVLVSALILIILFFIIGDRGLVIIASITIVAVYSSMVKKIRPAMFLIGILVGSILMFAVRVTRNTDVSIRSGNNGELVNRVEDAFSGADFLTIFSDLTNIHRELYIGYGYYESVGLIEPMQWVIVPFYPLPMIPNVLSKAMFGKTMNEIKPGVILNEYMAYTGHGHFGIHCVIDIFMRWGVVGVVFFFYMWGYVVKSLTYSKSKNRVGLALYIILLAAAIRIPRAPILDMLRVFAYVLFLAWASTLFFKRGVTTR